MKTALPDGAAAPSSWVMRWSHLVPAKGTVLDVACGQGRHAHWFYRRNHPLALVDIDQGAIKTIASSLPSPTVQAVAADIENEPWPFEGRQFSGVVVTNYLWRPLIPTLMASIATGGVLIYETFTQGQETIGKPSRPDFLLRPGELLDICRGLRIVAFEDGFQQGADAAPGRFVQRIAAVREPAGNPGLSEQVNAAIDRLPNHD